MEIKKTHLNKLYIFMHVCMQTEPNTFEFLPTKYYLNFERTTILVKHFPKIGQLEIDKMSHVV